MGITAFTGTEFTDFCSSMRIKQVLYSSVISRVNEVMLGLPYQPHGIENAYFTNLLISVPVLELKKSCTLQPFLESTKLCLSYQPRGIENAFLTVKVCDTEPTDLPPLRADASKCIVDVNKSRKKNTINGIKIFHVG